VPGAGRARDTGQRDLLVGPQPVAGRTEVGDGRGVGVGQVGPHAEVEDGGCGHGLIVADCAGSCHVP